MVLRVALRRSLAQVHHVSPVRPRRASGLVADVYAQVERDFGMLAPPVCLHSPAPWTLAACWSMLRETLVAAGQVDRATKEAVAVAVSLDNTCPYCVEVHGASLHSLLPGDDPFPAAGSRADAAGDPGIRRIADWARASRRPDGVRRPVPFPVAAAPEIIGVAVTFDYLNRMVNVFLGEGPIPPGAPAPVRLGARRLLGSLMRSRARRFHAPGLSLDLLPAAPLPGDLRWAEQSPSIAGAFGRAASAIDAAGLRSVPERVRDLVAARLAGWNGQAPGLRGTWVGEAVSVLPAAERAAGRLALLTALASQQIWQADIDQFQGSRPDESSLVELVSWSSLAAARLAGSRMWSTFRDQPAATGM